MKNMGGGKKIPNYSRKDSIKTFAKIVVKKSMVVVILLLIGLIINFLSKIDNLFSKNDDTQDIISLSTNNNEFF